MKKLGYFTILCCIAFVSFKAKDVQTVKEYLSMPNTIELNKTSYHLSWSSHPNTTYYKQEYLPAAQKSETFTNMLMVEALTGETTAQQAMKSKVAELQDRKKYDPVANYTLIESKNAGEFILEFILSQGKGKDAIVEWNVYRYMSLKEKEGTSGVLLLANCRRGYGAGTTAFLKLLKQQKQNDIDALSAYTFPQIKIKAN